MSNFKEILKQILKEELDLNTYFLKEKDLRQILNGYIDFALQQEERNLVPQGNIIPGKKAKFNPEDFTIDDVDLDSRIQQYMDIKKFLELAGEDAVMDYLTNDYDDITDQKLRNLGFDIWLSRNIADAGFAERMYDNDETEEKLMSAAQKLGGVTLAIGDDDMIYFE
jgi:hypothetical protein